MRSKRTKKLLNPNQPTERLGLIFVERMAVALKAIWRPTPNDDYGFDGELELTRSGEVTGYLVKAQVKSGTSYLKNKSTSGFDFYVEPADAGYWTSTNVPVILIVYDPSTDNGYWLNVKKYARDHPEFATSLTLRFSFRANRLTSESLLDLSEIAIPDESERTEFLVDQIREHLHSNMLPVSAVPPAVYEAEFSARRLIEAHEAGYSIAKARSGKYLGFTDPTLVASPLRAYIDAATVKEVRYPEYLHRSSTRNYAIGRWNDAIRCSLLDRGLLQKDEDTFYFPPEQDGAARKITWESTRGRTPERQVAYPYEGKQSKTVAFWVHHACRVSFCEIGGHLFLRLTPAYVFSRDGKALIAGKEAGSLSTSRKSKERNYQVLNHLMFWLWYLSDGTSSISMPIDDSELVVATTFMAGDASFGIPADKKSLIEIISAEHEVDWAELEAAAEAGGEEDE